MNGKYYGKLEIRWHSREKDRLERINKERVSKNEKNQSKKHIHRSGSRHMA